MSASPSAALHKLHKLHKLHGLGNDFLVLLDVDGAHPIDADLARRWCDRHTGIGADGLVRGSRGPDGTLAFELRNADGSVAEMSGNGMRCLAHAFLLAGLIDAGDDVAVSTVAGARSVRVRSADGSTVWSSVGMGVARLVGAEGGDHACNVGDGRQHVDMGNPHLVVLGPDPACVAVGELGPTLERAVAGGQNVEFVAIGPGPDEITMRVWERGVGETRACGTGACAAAVAVHAWGRVGRRVTVHQPGGSVEVAIADDGSVTLSGPSVHVAAIHPSEWPSEWPSAWAAGPAGIGAEDGKGSPAWV